MDYLDLTLASPQENLACDEVLLELADHGLARDSLRVWQAPDQFIVLGYSNRYDDEVCQEGVDRTGVPVLRRRSGGGAVVQGPGCLSYSLVLTAIDSGPLPELTEVNRRIMTRHARIMSGLTGQPVEARGITDLAIAGRKFSGNASRRKKRAILFHGTFLLDFDLDAIGALLNSPARQPDYRQQRSHSDFVMNVGVPAEAVKRALRTEWGATPTTPRLPVDEIRTVARDVYATPEWTHRF